MLILVVFLCVCVSTSLRCAEKCWTAMPQGFIYRFTMVFLQIFSKAHDIRGPGKLPRPGAHPFMLLRF